VHHPVLIAGASFAGLAAARILGPAALLLDRASLGAGQTSACAAPAALVECAGAGEAILQRHDHLRIAVGEEEVRWPLPEPFCTFDYRAYCRLAFAASGAHFLRASVQRIEEDGRVHTTAGTFPALAVVDARGPRSALAGAARGRRLAFGLETEIPAAPSAGLRFYFLPEVPDGYAWAFPCGPTTRFGVLSYRGKTRLLPALRRFLRRFGLAPGSLHGGFLATGLSPTVVGRTFVAGDAAGHCLPLTGEGIRTAVRAGELCGHLLQGVLRGQWALEEAAAHYRAAVRRERGRFRALLWLNAAVLLLPRPLLRPLLRAVSRPVVLEAFFRRYLAIFAPKDVGAA